MSRRPLVSVVTIFLDAARFLEEAIASVYAQTWDRWELLLVDDGSTDGSTAIACRRAARDPARVRHLEHDGHANRGMSASRNLGIREAAGEYVAFIDADDMWLPRKLEAQVAILEAHPRAGMTCGAALYWSSWTGRAEDEDVVLPVGAPADALVEPPGLLRLLYPLGPGTAPCPSDLVFRRQALEAVGGFEERFRGSLQMYEDQALLAKVYLTIPVFVSGACHLRYRLHPDSCVSTVTRAGEYHAVRRFFLDWYEGYLAERGLRGTDAWRLLGRAQWPYRHPVLARLGSGSAAAARRAGGRGLRLASAFLQRAGLR